MVSCNPRHVKFEINFILTISDIFHSVFESLSMAPKLHTAVDVKETNAGTEPTKPLIHSTQIYNEKGLTLIQRYSCHTGIYYFKCLNSFLFCLPC